MASESENIRQILNLMESAKEPALLEGWVDNFANRIQRRLGGKERQQMAGRLKKEWSKWLGQAGREGTMDDMVRFMKVHIGFTDQDVGEVLQKFQPAGEKPADADDNAEAPARKIARGEPGSPEKPADPDGFDPEEGVPLPKGLNTKLSDYADLKAGDKKPGAKKERPVVKDNPAKYKLPNGDWDRKKISAKLDTLPMGTTLDLGQLKKTRTVGADADVEFAESRIDEKGPVKADENQPLPAEIVDQIMDFSAAHINDEYLYHGPKNDQSDDDEEVSNQRGGRGRYGNSSPNTGGAKGSGQYDAEEMWDILKIDFEKTKPWMDSLTRKVSKARSISEMSDNDMRDLALIAYAFLRSRT